MSDRALRTWVEEKLFQLFGLSERSLVDYILGKRNAFHGNHRAEAHFNLIAGLAGRASSAENLLSRLLAADIPSGSATRDFARDLYALVAGAGGGRRADRAATAAPADSSRTAATAADAARLLACADPG